MNNKLPQCLLEDVYYSISFMRWDRFIRNKRIKEIYRIVLESEDKYFLYFYSAMFKYKIKDIHNKVLKLKDPKTLYLFYKNIECTKKKFLSCLIKTKNLKYLFKLGEEVDSKYLKMVRKRIESSKQFKPYYAVRLLKYYPNDNNLIKYILNSNKPRYLLKLAIELNNKELSLKIQNYFMENEYTDYLISLAAKSDNIDFRESDRYMKYTGDIDKMKKYIKRVRQNNIADILLLL